MMGNRRERIESSVSVSDFVPLVDVLESVPAEEVVPTVPIDVHVQDKNKEDSDKVPNKSSDEDWDEVFPEKTKGKNKKRGRTEAETVTVTPVKKKKQKNLQVMHRQEKLQGLSKTEKPVGKPN